MDATPNPRESAAATPSGDPAAVEIILARHPKVLEAIVVSGADAVRGEAWVAFVIPKQGIAPSPELRDELRKSVTDQVGPSTLVNDLRFADSLPKTRSGKILRRTLQERATGAANHSD